jgi:hypothetical protein
MVTPPAIDLPGSNVVGGNAIHITGYPLVPKITAALVLFAAFLS